MSERSDDQVGKVAFRDVCPAFLAALAVSVGAFGWGVCDISRDCQVFVFAGSGPRRWVK